MAERVAAYPRPPALLPCSQHVRVEALGRVLCDTRRSLRVLETFHPPVFYLCPEDVDQTLLEPVAGSSFCEWKGVARYFDLVAPIAWARSGACGGLSGATPRPRRPSRPWPAGWPAIRH